MSSLPTDVVEDCCVPVQNPSEISERRDKIGSLRPFSNNKTFTEERTDSGIDSFQSLSSINETADELGSLRISPPQPQQRLLASPVPDEDGDTDLHLAIIHEKKDIVFHLIKHAFILSWLELYNNLVQTPLHLAAITRQEDVCRWLVVAGANVDSTDRNGNTPLHVACSQGDCKTIRALTRPIMLEECKHITSAHIPIRAQTLPQNLEIKNFEGFTCIHMAAFNHHKHVIQYLTKELGANIDAQDGKSGRTALHHMVEERQVEMITFLVLFCGANVNSVTYDGCTPLHLAVGRGYQEEAQLLLSLGANVACINSECETPQDLALGHNMAALLEPSYNDFTINGNPVYHH